ncbi:hypothetical protein [Spartinivicinus poritis]|uniref:Uncharacterized protein n=1 Tax=Spartinivicinus poritis TaxID=2994640 RepID=A0ABT5UCX0_9GAMM|nr:hypothetical protein [Spartinivicinus sp. A2-2]MDE1464227.1 hypothetical protein [Spartinivicinus sp. A2-2]
MQDKLLFILLANYSLVITIFIALALKQLNKINKNNKDFLSHKFHTIEKYLKQILDETSDEISLNGELNTKDFLSQKISKRHILFLRRSLIHAELELVQHSISNEKIYSIQTEYHSLIQRLHREVISIIESKQVDYITYLSNQLQLLNEQQTYHGKVSLTNCSITDLTLQNFLTFRKELIKIESAGLKRKLEKNNFHHFLHERYKILIDKLLSANSNFDIKKINESYAVKLEKKYSKDIKSYQDKIKHLEDLKSSYEAIINELNAKENIKIDDSDINNEILQNFSAIIKASNEKILALEEDIKKYEISISEINAKNDRLKKKEHEGIDIEDIEEKKMLHEFFEDITKLTKKINALENEKVTLQQQIKEKNKTIHSLKSSDYKQAYESAISKLKMLNHSYEELEEMYIKLLKQHQNQSSDIKKVS